MTSTQNKRASITSISDVDSNLVTCTHEWKQTTLDACYCELKIRFPITGEMLLDIQNLIQKKYPDAEEVFNLEKLKVCFSFFLAAKNFDNK